MSGYQVLLWKPWNNYSKGNVESLTITVPADTGVLIVAALAVLVGLAGAATWIIMSFALHQIRARDLPQDGLFRMQQVSLRNPSGPAASLWELLQLGHAWSGKASNARTRACTLALWPLVAKVVFIVASVFVARVTVAAHKANAVLLRPTNCGIETSMPATAAELEGTINYHWAAKQTNDTRRSQAYVDQCYGAPEGTLGCSRFAVQRLPWTLESDVACPFPNFCRLGPTGAIKMDTGVLDSHIHLGINAQPKHRVGFRRTAVCSVLPPLGPYTNVSADPMTKGNTLTLEIKLGTFGLVDAPVLNYTAVYNTITFGQSVNYKIISHSKPAEKFRRTPRWSDFNPIAPLNLTDADLTLVFLMPNGVLYEGTTLDPMFSSNGSWTYQDFSNTTWYMPDEYVTAYACSEQLQFCSPAKDGCGPAQGWMQYDNDDYGALGFTAEQRATAFRVGYAHATSLMHHAASAGAASLAANDYLVDEIQSPALPDDQWVVESTRWFQTSLANIQHRIADYPTNNWALIQTGHWNTSGPTAGVLHPKDWIGLDGPALEKQCSTQLARITDEYQSFVLVGVIVVIVVSFALIIASWTVHLCLSKRKDRQTGGGNRHKLLAHIADGKSHLAYASLRAAGYTGWQQQMDDMPVRHVQHHKDTRDIEAVVEHNEVISQPGPRDDLEESIHELLPLDTRRHYTC